MTPGDSVKMKAPVTDINVSPFITLLLKGRLRSWNPRREPVYMEWDANENQLMGYGMMFPGDYELQALSKVEYVCVGPIPELTRGQPNMYELVHKTIEVGTPLSLNPEDGVAAIVVLNGTVRDELNVSYGPGKRVLIKNIKTFSAVTRAQIAIANRKPQDPQ